MKKLALSKETVLTLTQEQKEQVAGGQPISYLSRCDYCYTEDYGPKTRCLPCM